MPGRDVAGALAQAPEAVGRALAAVPEDQWFDRKSFRIDPRRLAEALVAFANADGGIIAVGLHAGRIEGTRSDHRHRSALMQAAIDHTQPAVPATTTLRPCVNDAGQPDDLLLFEVPPSSAVHATNRDEVFLRVGDETRRLTFAQRRELLYDKGQAAFETEPTHLGLADVDRPLLDNYAETVGAPDPSRLLRARGLLIAGERLSIAGALLFAAEPTAVLPNAHIRVTRFLGSARGTGSRQRLTTDVRIEKPIPRALQEARTTIVRLQPTRRALGPAGSFDDIPLVPEDAWLEGVVNAAVHRSYSMGGDHIHVDVFDDRIEIESPGRFPGVVDLSDLLHVTRFARNPRIARVCADLRMGQEFGEGIRRMVEEMRLAGLADPVYEQTSGSVRLTLSGDLVTRDLDARLPGETRLIVKALREAGHLGTGDIADLIGATRPTAIRRLQRLREAGVIEWVGKSARDPRAHWRLPH
jgi:ATP-dependent DNA helicase RecG